MRLSRVLLSIAVGLLIVTAILYFKDGKYIVTAVIGIIINTISMSLSMKERRIEE